MSFIIREKDQLFYGEFTEFTDNKIIAVTSFRKAGYSPIPFDSLNLGLHTEDEKDNVLKNRELFFKTLDLDYSSMTALKQVHGNRVVQVTVKDKGKGAINYNDSLDEADAMVTDAVHVPLVVFTADCLPVFFMDPGKRIIGLAHAGRQGTCMKICENVIKAMTSLGADSANITVGFGPAIGKCCYEVGKEIGEIFDKKYIETKNESSYLDLNKINRDVLILSGVNDNNIIQSDYCTLCHSDLCYSYRENNKTGRMASVIMLWE